MFKEKVILIISIVISLIITTSYISKTKEVDNKLVRIHIIANSDSEVDQEIKIKVKEKIEKYINDNYINQKNIDEILNNVRKDKIKIINIAKEICSEKYDVRLEILTEKFPLKEYDDEIINQGEYNAIKIILGEGNGHNWWQAIYPKLSFPEESYEIVEDNGTDEIKYQVNFKLIEIIKDAFFKS